MIQLSQNLLPQNLYLDMPAPSHPHIRITASSSSQLLKFPVMALELTAPKHPHSPHRRWVESSSFATASTTVIMLFLRFPDKGCLSIIHFDFTTLVHHIPPASMEKSKSMAPLRYRTALELSHSSVICFFHEDDTCSCSLSMCFFNELAWPCFTKKDSTFHKEPSTGTTTCHPWPQGFIALIRAHAKAKPRQASQLELLASPATRTVLTTFMTVPLNLLLKKSSKSSKVRDTTSDGDPRHFCGKCQIKIANLAISPVTSCWASYQKLLMKSKNIGPS